MGLRDRIDDKRRRTGKQITYDDVLDFHLRLREVYGIDKNERDFFARFYPQETKDPLPHERYRSQKSTTPSLEPIRVITLDEGDPYLILKEGMAYPLAVSLHKLGDSHEVKSVSKRLNLRVGNTARELDGTPYIGNIRWEEAIRLNKELGNVTLSLAYFLKFYRVLDDIAEGRMEVLDEKNRPVNKGLVIATRDEISDLRDTYRGEWLHAKFSRKGKLVYVTYPVINQNGKLREVSEPLAKDTLMEDRSISLEDLLLNSTSQGLPRKNILEGNVRYWSPGNGSVAWFFAWSGRAWLSCYRYPQYSNASLGVRPAKILS